MLDESIVEMAEWEFHWIPIEMKEDMLTELSVYRFYTLIKRRCKQIVVCTFNNNINIQQSQY